MDLPDRRGISIKIVQTEQPWEAARTVVITFLRQYEELMPALKEAVFQLWSPYVQKTIVGKRVAYLR